ncbi:uncharacterized protein LOC123504493 [Portunus trituberculatus]|uniref:uncharacterized protein LOC123504493 n=1 Tax=Portunus trituberculatus TaxID=210409 RepID=UPI001E1CC42D|nr:uncharacterized protein LOC123504493 [Portunus trituberculatus]
MSPPKCMKPVNMTSAPKKRDFFNGSQGLNKMDLINPEPTETHEEDMALDCDLTSRGTNNFYSSQKFLGHSSADHLFPSFSNRQNSAYNRQDSCLPFTSRNSFQTKSSIIEDSGSASESCQIASTIEFTAGNNFDESKFANFCPIAPTIEIVPGNDFEENQHLYEVIMANYYYYVVGGIIGTTPKHTSWAGFTQIDHLDKDGGNDNGKKKIQKRKQRGRRYGYTRQHNSGYEIIHKKEEHEQQQNVKLGLPPPSLPPKHTDFPGLKELVEETASNSDDEEFYRQLDKRVKFINNQYSVMRENTSAQKDKYKP